MGLITSFKVQTHATGWPEKNPRNRSQMSRNASHYATQMFDEGFEKRPQICFHNLDLRFVCQSPTIGSPKVASHLGITFFNLPVLLLPSQRAAPQAQTCCSASLTLAGKKSLPVAHL
jgi:hypothetical protein